MLDSRRSLRVSLVSSYFSGGKKAFLSSFPQQPTGFSNDRSSEPRTIRDDDVCCLSGMAGLALVSWRVEVEEIRTGLVNVGLDDDIPRAKA